MAFNPPGGVANGATYGYGNMLWEYAADSGVWNIVGGSLIGSIGPTGATGVGGAASVPLATTSLTGVASFKSTDFAVSITGQVTLSSNVALRGNDNTFYGSNSFSNPMTAPQINTGILYPIDQDTGLPTVGASGYIAVVPDQLELQSEVVALGDSQGTIGSNSIYISNVGANPFTKLANGDDANINLYKTGLQFGEAGYTYPLMITGGVFRNPTEFAPHFLCATGNNQLVINGISGSIQRFTIQPTNRVTVQMGTGWHSLTAATETIAVIVQNKSTMTGGFESGILTEGSPILFGQDTATNTGVNGGISILTIMRVNKGGGTYLNMGFVIATGMTGSNFLIN